MNLFITARPPSCLPIRYPRIADILKRADHRVQKCRSVSPKRANVIQASHRANQANPVQCGSAEGEPYRFCCVIALAHVAS